MKERLKDREFWFCLMGVIGYYIFGISNVLNQNNTTYALEQIHSYDNSIFADNLAITSRGMSARFFMNFIVGTGMKLTNGSWTAVVIPLMYLGIVVLAVATVEIVFNITEKYRIFLVIILAFFLKNSINTGFPGWGSFELDSLGMGTAYTFTMLAFSQVIGERKKWNVAWIMLSIAALCHVHEGLWGFCLLFIMYACQVVKEGNFGFGKRHWAFCVFVVVMGICIIPGLFGEDSGITSAEFVQIYAYYRTPHHLVPSAWGLNSITKYLSVIVASAVLRWVTLHFTNKENVKNFRWEAVLAIFSWIGAVCMIYLFTEIVPVASIVTMYISKYLKYVGILSQIWCIKNVRDWLNKNDYLIAGVSTVTVLAGSGYDMYGVALIYGATILIIFLWEHFKIKELRLLLLISVFTIVVSKNVRMFIPSILCILLIYMVALWNQLVWIQRLVKSTAFVVIASLLILCIGTRDKFWTIDNGHFSRMTANSYLVRGVGDELYYLAQDFKDTTTKEAMFISDPNDGITCNFQLAAERNCYTNNKNVPAAQNQIKEWYDRVMETKGLFDKDITEIYGIMDAKNIEYLLVKSDYFEQFDESDLYEVRNVSYGDRYRIYEMR